MKLQWNELSRYALLMLEQGTGTRAYIEHVAASNGVSLKPSMELGSLDLLNEFARTSFGIASVVVDFVEEELAKGDLIHLAIDPPIPPRGIGIVTLKGVPLSAAAQAFVAILP
ncbi:LysR family transcriptional regulator substrate-binding protein [Paenibacillus xylaniclasticus]|uniref:LysR family transcriptional regulator substrate-binding protein n=1 Tax=Paenibacillus xylaniclasticus TaxID=588083 RepID=UPI0013E032C8|nr:MULTISPECIES: LysR family transcriptional regulator substrate-binding protein [Paenibacillus]GFN33712.1 hypothetical protein PCURB6_39720 [Paenibacillus curdlanolyticus]